MTLCNGVRLSQEWAGRRFRLLLNLIDHLPAHSHYGVALAQDDDLARDLLDRERRGLLPAPNLPLSSYTPEVRFLSVLADRIGLAVQVLSNGSYRPPPSTPWETTALDRVRVDNDGAVHLRITAQLLPHAAEEVSDAVPG